MTNASFATMHNLELVAFDMLLRTASAEAASLSENNSLLTLLIASLVRETRGRA